ncbi:hypothetical protein FGO68_gene784 [Halteria grandinella]|uniref:Isobutyryl-CoA dehydrogenase, mitochondrial n=1 Tax=Halteria grandinella TaxID=5974 RepID=A0A8J8T220_HALGN|nr:hypothetical protein FGO68_gene784 [Halteria grandinella]
MIQSSSRSVSLLINDQNLEEDQRLIQKTAYEFAEQELAPNAAEWDENKHFPLDVYKKAAELGFAGIYVSEKYGGCGLGRLEATLIFEGLSTGCVGSSAYISIHNMCAWMIDQFGNEEQKQRWLPEMCLFEKFSSYCLTEPDSGSDAQAMKTFAKEEGDYFVLNGSKAFISAAGASDYYLIMCKTGEKEVSCILVEKGTPGLSFGKNEFKMGWNVQPTRLVILEDCKVPKGNLIGSRGQGFKIALQGLDGGRLNIAACSLGGAARCLDTATDYIKGRKQFGRPLADNQHLQFKLAQMAIELEASRLMVRHAARLLTDKSPNYTMYCAMAKKLATDRCFDIVNDALQMHGGYGYLKEYPIERFLRDLRVHQILEGTNEIMMHIIQRTLLKDA